MYVYKVREDVDRVHVVVELIHVTASARTLSGKGNISLEGF